MSKEIKIGILTIVGLVSLIWGYNFLKGKNLFQAQSIYQVNYDNISQLEVSAPVFINGYQVGNVNKIEIDPTNLQTIVVSLEILPEIRLPQNTIAQLSPSGVMGDMAISLIYSGVCTDDCIENGGFIQGTTQSFLGSFVNPDELDQYITQIKSGVGSMVDTLNQILGDPDFDNTEMGKLVKSMQITVLNLEQGTQALNAMMRDNARAFKEISENLSRITGGIADNQESLNQTIQNVATMTRSLADGGLDKTLENTNAALEKLSLVGDETSKTMHSLEMTSTKLTQLLDGINKGQGTMGQLMKNEQVYVELRSTLQNLDLLLQDFRLNPKRYVNVSIFGKKPSEYTLPENDPAMMFLDTITEISESQ